MPDRYNNYRHQTGIALVTALVIMMVLTILGVTVMNMTSLEEKMAFNTQDRYLSRYLTESSVLYLATPAQLPSPQQPGDMTALITIESGKIPGAKSAEGQIAYTEDTPYVNLPKTNSRSQYISSGSGDDNAVVYQIHASTSTPAGTTSQLKAGYYYVRHNQN